MTIMGFIVINETFVCRFCGENNPPAFRTCRNHCRKCLCSFHVDENFPGDRNSLCCGKMILKEVVSHPTYDFMLTHQCEKCGKEIKNRAADDDDREVFFVFLKKKAENFAQKKVFLKK